MERWSGRVALVTGASSGIGEATATKLVHLGMTVVGCARNIESIQALSACLVNEEGTLVAIRCDISRETEVLAMFDQIRRKFGGIDVCINNAGLAYDAPLLSGATGQWREMLEVNVLGLSVCTREAVRSMREKGVDDGHIIQINSLCGHRVLSYAATHFYSATKYAVTALLEGIRTELRDCNSNIRISGISPGMVNTDFVTKMFPNMKQVIETKKDAENKSLQADDIADIVLHILSSPVHVQIHDVLVRATTDKV